MPATAATVLTLPEMLDLTAAAPLRDALLAHRGRALTLDASNVRRMGGLCLQVLAAARTAWATDDLSLTVTAPSPAFTEASDLLGWRFETGATQ